MCSVFGLSSRPVPPLRHYRAGPFAMAALRRGYWLDAIIAGLQLLGENTLKVKAWLMRAVLQT